MREPVLVARVGVIHWYNSVLDNQARVVGGGGYTSDNQGAEADNFRPAGDSLQGYVRAGGRLKLRRISPATDGVEVAGVTVLFFATHPGGGEFLVGWYRDAKVLAEYRDEEGRPFNLEADRRQAVLLPMNLRSHVSAPARGQGGIGQANVRYLLSPTGQDESAPWRHVLRFGIRCTRAVMAR